MARMIALGAGLLAAGAMGVPCASAETLVENSAEFRFQPVGFALYYRYYFGQR